MHRNNLILVICALFFLGFFLNSGNIAGVITGCLILVGLLGALSDNKNQE